jgi:ER lumen protein retaining receptor
MMGYGSHTYHDAIERELSQAALSHNTTASNWPGFLSDKRLLIFVDRLQEPGYFEPLCTARHLSVRFYDWEPSRYAGDAAHLIALGLCLLCLLRESGTGGVSFKAHLLFLMVFTSRFVNILFCAQPIYLVIYKVILWQFTLMIVLIMCFRGSMYDKKDTLPLSAVFLPTLALTLVFGKYSTGDHGLVAEILWFFSNYLEGIAMLPQYIYCYRDSENKANMVFAYVTAMGLYQGVFGMHWIVRLCLTEGYLDSSSFVNGVMGVVCFADYVVFKVKTHSPLSKICLVMDEGLQEVREMVKTLQQTLRRSFSNREFDLIPVPVSPALCAAGPPVGKPVLEEVELAEAHMGPYDGVRSLP